MDKLNYLALSGGDAKSLWNTYKGLTNNERAALTTLMHREIADSPFVVELVRQTVEARIFEPYNSPSLTELATKFGGRARFKPELLQLMIKGPLSHVLNSGIFKTSHASDDSLLCSRTMALLSDIVGVITVQVGGLPKLEHTSKVIQSAGTDLIERLRAVFPRNSPTTKQLGPLFVWIRLCIRLAEKNEMMDKVLNARLKDFSILVDEIIRGANITFEQLLQYLPAPDRTHDNIPLFHECWTSILMETPRKGRDGASSRQLSSTGSLREWLNRWVPTLGSDQELTIRTASELGKRDVDLIIKNWNRLQARLSTEEANNSDLSGTFERLLWLFVNVGHYTRAADVWTTMNSVGLKRSIRHWNPMLSACKRKSDSVSIKKLWVEMISSGTVPDNQAWTTYIVCVLKNGEWKTAFEIIDQMEKVWKSAAENSTNHEVEEKGALHKPSYGPSIIPVSAAIDGLLKLKRPQSAQAVLSWAEDYGLEPRTDTFNSFLRFNAIHEGNVGIRKTLALMKAHSCIPDAITFTILLKYVLRDATPEQQIAAVDKMFTDMEATGLEATPQTYAVLMNSLLRPLSRGKEPNVHAAKAVLTHMREKNMIVPIHALTTMMNFFFRCNPPDIDGVESIWAYLQKQAIVPDHVLFKAAINGYAKFGEIDKMLRTLRHMLKDGHTAGWGPMSTALSILAERHEWQLCADVIELAFQRFGPPENSTQGNNIGKEHFVRICNDLDRAGCVKLPWTRQSMIRQS